MEPRSANPGIFVPPKKIEELGEHILHKLLNDRYRVLDHIGQGGMGVVFLASDKKLERQIVLKVFVGEFDSGNDLDRAYNLYLQESRIAASLRHPNIVSIYDVDVLTEMPDRNPFIAMEYIKGASLADLIQQNQITFADKVKVFVQVAGALDYAHSNENPVLHRDIKPKNILVGENQRAVLIDFGLSRFLDGTTTAMGLFKGSASYMAPEIITAYMSQDVEKMKMALVASSDLYSLGCTMYRSFTDRNPFPGSALFEVIQSIRTSPPALPSSLNPGIPKELDEIIMRLLMHNPADRFKSAKEVRSALKALSERENKPNGQQSITEDTASPVESSFHEVLDDIFDDSKFKNVEELQALRMQRRSDDAAKKKVEEEINGEDIRKLIELVRNARSDKPAQRQDHKRLILTGMVLIVLFLGYFLFKPFGGKAVAKKSVASQLEDSMSGNVKVTPPLLEVDETATSVRKGYETVSYPKNAGLVEPVRKTSPSLGKNRANWNGTDQQRKVNSMGDDLMVWSKDGKKSKIGKNYGVPSGTVIKDLYLLNKIVSQNVSSPVRAELRVDFKLDEQIILPRGTVFIGKVKTLASDDRVFVEFSKLVRPNHEETEILGTGLMDDGSSGIAGMVTYPKGSTPGSSMGVGLLADAGKAALSGFSADGMGEKVGKSVANSSLNSGTKLMGSGSKPMPIIVVEPYTPIQVYLEEGF